MNSLTSQSTTWPGKFGSPVLVMYLYKVTGLEQHKHVSDM